MRVSLRRLAAAKPSRYLEPYAPTGLTGLFTHPQPRAQLIYLYAATLEKVAALPASSVYRQSAEALAKHRLQIVESVVPDGWVDWKAKYDTFMKENPKAFEPVKSAIKFGNAETGIDEEKLTKEAERGNGSRPEDGWKLDDRRYRRHTAGGKDFVEVYPGPVDGFAYDIHGEGQEKPDMEDKLRSILTPPKPKTTIDLEPEPQWTSEEVEKIQNQIGAGLIEEVIEVAHGELKLVDIMLQAKVWEDLEELPRDGQWTYFNRDTGAGASSTPPQ